jgi:hypothetical protein
MADDKTSKKGKSLCIGPIPYFYLQRTPSNFWRISSIPGNQHQTARQFTPSHDLASNYPTK